MLLLRRVKKCSKVSHNANVKKGVATWLKQQTAW